MDEHKEMLLHKMTSAAKSGRDRVRLLAVATAVPPHVLMQDDVVDAARSIFAGRYADFERLSRVFASAGVVKRHAARPISWFVEPHGWPERTAAYLEVADALFVEATLKALAAAGKRAEEIDTIVTVSSTGIATPSLEARVATRLGFRRDVLRVPVFGLGCAAGVSGLAIAARLAVARPGSCVLFVAIELCTLAFRLDELTKANIVATALFGDGAAACVLSSAGQGLAIIEGAGDHTWPDTLAIMGWRVDATGFGVVFARSIPRFVTAEMAAAVAGILDRLGLAVREVDRFVCHAGGAKVIAALETALELEPGTLDHERAVLAEYGNMSAPTVLFVLERVLAGAMPGRAVLTAMGPGFTASCISLTRPM